MKNNIEITITDIEKEIINKIKYFSEKYGHERTVIEFEQDVLSYKNAYLSNLFALNVEGANLHAHEKVVLKSNDPLRNYEFAYKVKGADIKAHEKIILDSEDPYYCLLFARDIKGADIKALADIVLKSKNPSYNLWFAHDVEGADVEAHLEITRKEGGSIFEEVIDSLLTDEPIDTNTYNSDVDKIKKLFKELEPHKVPWYQ